MRAIVFGLVILLSATAQAHGGGLDKYGCHVDSRTGQRHCHRDTGSAAPSTEKSQGLSTGQIVLVAGTAAALIGVGVYFLAKAGSDPFAMTVAATPAGLSISGTF